MSYTIISGPLQGPVATVVSSMADALSLARRLRQKGLEKVLIATDDGNILTIEDLERGRGRSVRERRPRKGARADDVGSPDRQAHGHIRLP